MKIEKINDSELLWSLDKEDFRAYEIELNDILMGTQKAKNLFQEAIEIAKKDLMFQSDNAHLYCQLQDVNPDGARFSIKRKEQSKRNPDQVQQEETKISRSAKVCCLLYRFLTLDEVISVSKQTGIQKKLENSLYWFEGEYLLLVKPDPSQQDQMNLCSYVLSEFAEMETINRGIDAMIREHSQCILTDNALQNLSKIFTTNA